MSTLIRVFRKLVIDPWRYGWRDYDAERYWGDRYRRFGMAMRGSGNEAKTETDNLMQYAKDLGRFLALLRHGGMNLRSSVVLDVGCGTGFYAEACKQNGAKDYVGVDVTDTLFLGLRERYPDYLFIKASITEPEVPYPKRFDLALLIDVLEHITTTKRLSCALAHLRESVVDGGAIVLGPVGNRSGKRMFYLRDWSESDILRHFPGHVCTSIEFKKGRLLLLRGR